MPAIPASDRDLLDGQPARLADRLGAKYRANLRDHDQPGQSRVKVVIRPVG